MTTRIKIIEYLTEVLNLKAKETEYLSSEFDFIDKHYPEFYMPYETPEFIFKYFTFEVLYCMQKYAVNDFKETAVSLTSKLSNYLKVEILIPICGKKITTTEV